MSGDRPRLADGQPIPEGPGVYLLHYADPSTGKTARYRHAGHYVGYADDIPTRIREELAGTAKAANLLKVVYAAGLGAVVDTVWAGKRRGGERRLKNRGGTAQYCTRCRTEHPTTRGRQQQHRSQPAQPAADTASAAGRPAPRARISEFLRLNPAFQHPTRAGWAVQYSRARGREEPAVLGHRVRFALEDDNHPLSQNRAAAVIGRARAARRQARQDLAEQERPQRLAEQTRQQLPLSRAAQLAARTHPEGHERER